MFLLLSFYVFGCLMILLKCYQCYSPAAIILLIRVNKKTKTNSLHAGYSEARNGAQYKERH